MQNNKDRPVKVLFFHIMKENFSGAQKNIYRLLINLDKQQITPILIGQMESELTKLSIKNDIKVHIIPFPAGLKIYDGGLLKFNLKRIYYFLKSLWIYNQALIKQFDQIKPDVVWSDNIRTFVTIYAACKLSRVKIIWNIWSEPQGKVAWVLHRLGLVLADRVNLEYSNQGRKLFGSLSEKSIFKNKVIPLYTGVSDFDPIYGTDIRKELSLAYDSVILIMASNIVPGKGQLDLIKCMGHITNEFTNVHLLISGSPVDSNQESIEYYQNIYKFVLSNKLSDSVHFLGWRSDIRDLYQQSNVYISTSYSESFPDSVREAMLASLPVIVTDVGGTRELVDVGSNGYLFNPGDLNSLVKYMRILLKDSVLRHDMGINSKRIIETRFSTKVYAKEFENMVHNLAVR
jgi:glycosyltransferase involved in cell wall biosynthesis